MLGEAALTDADAERYLDAYHKAIGAVARSIKRARAIEAAPSISVKLSALFPRYEFTQRRRVLAELAPRLHELAIAARDGGIALTVDAEEAERLELSLELIEHVARSPQLEGWNGLRPGGAGVSEARARRDPLAARARAARRNARLNVRLVKGAYWDSEIKRAQERGLAGYPVFTRKVNTDVSYLACARELIARGPEHLSAVRDAQCADGRDDHRAGGAGEALVRVPAPAWHGRGAVCADRRRGQARPAVPRVCAGRLARGSAAVSGAPAAGERREYVVRQSHRR